MWLFISLISLLVIVVIALQFPQVQTFITSKAANYLSNKIGTEVRVGEVNITFPKSVLLKDIYVEDQQQDTLLFAQRIEVDVDMLGLFSNKLEVNYLALSGITAHVRQTLPDSAFNFDFIIEAFATDTTTAQPQQPADTSAAMAISVNKIELKDIYGTYNDEVLGIDAMMALGNLVVKMDEMDLETMKFYVDEIELNNTVARVKITKEPPPSEEDTTTSAFPDLMLNRLHLSNIDAQYENTTVPQKMQIGLGEFTTTAKKIDIANGRYELGKVELLNTNAWIAQGKPVKADTVANQAERAKEAAEVESGGMPLVASLDQLYLKNNNVRFDNNAAAPAASGMDFNHLFLKNIQVDIKDIYYSENDMRANVQQVQASEKSGFVLKKLNAKINVDSNSARLENLDVETSRSELHHDLLLKYASLAAIGENPADLYIEATLENSLLAFADVLLLAPDLAAVPPFAGNPGESVAFEGKMQGRIDDLDIDNFALATGRETRLALQGKVKGLPDMEKSWFDVKLKELHTTRQDVQDLLPDTMLPPSIRLPEEVNLQARFTGSMTDFDANADLRTTFGNMTASLEMHPDPYVKRTNYATTLDVEQFNVGRLLKQDSTLGKVTMQGTVEGSGLTLEEMEANLDLVVQQAEVMQYTYKDLKVRGTLSEQQFTGVAQMQDSNLYFTFNGQVDITDSVPESDFQLVLEGANLKALNLTTEDIRVKTTMTANMEGADLNDLQAKIDIRDFLLIKDGQKYAMDSLLVVTLNEENKTDLQINSTLLDASLKGNLNLGDLPAALQNHFARYFAFEGDTTANAALLPNDFSFEMHIKDPGLLTDVFLPDLEKLDPGTISGKFDSQNDNLEIHLTMPHIVYTGIVLDSLQVDINSNANTLNYNVKLAEIANSSIRVDNPTIAGRLRQDSIYIDFSITNDDGYRELELGGVLGSIDSNYRFRFLPGQVVFAGQEWEVARDNYLQFGPSGFFASNIKLENRGRMLSINSPKQNPQSPLNLNFRDFNLSLFSQAIERDTNLVSGLLNGMVEFNNLTENPAFTADLNIQDFSFNGDTLGNIAVKANNRIADQYDVNVGITGNGNDVQLAGIYNAANEQQALDFNVKINNLNLASMDGYTMGQLDSMSGSIRGDVTIKGAATQPNINGFVKFDGASFRVTYTGVHYTIRDDRIDLNNQGIAFNNFTIRDSENHTAVINGNIKTQDFTKMDFGLNLKTNSFLIVNSTEEDNELFWGKVLLTSDVRVRGDLNKPIVEASATLEDGSSFTMAIPETEPATVDREGIVEFVDFDNNLNPVMQVGEQRDTTRSEITGIDLSAAITLTKASEFKILTDQAAGNYLQVRGDATLSYGIDPSGKMTLTGRYEIAEGIYQLTYYNFIKRKFEIEKGSSITWNGDVMDARIDLTAKTIVETSAADLLADEISGYAQEDANRFKQKLPFIVALNLHGDLMKPEVDFDIELPPDKRGALGGVVQAKLTRLNQPEEESQLNKQVFALLVLQRFIQEDPLATTSEGGGVESAARQGVSQLLTQQLNQLSGKYIKGVDLTFDLESYNDYSSGSQEQRTELNIGLSKAFFNDRVEVNVGGNVDLEGESSKQNNLNNIAGDVAVEYKITPDGIYRLRGFRKTEYEGLLEGEVIETGVALIFTRDYNKLKDLFRKKARKEEDVQVTE